MRRSRAVWLVLLLALLPVRGRAQAFDAGAFDAYAAQAARDWNVPGMAVAVVQDGRIVFEKGYGVRRMGSPEPVDAHTLFAVGSTTKAFTVATLLMLADSGKVDLDAPVRRYLPQLELKDPFVTRDLTVRDLLTHRSGVEANDFVWLLGYPRADLIRRMRYLPQVAGPRARYAYNNLSYMLAGEVAAAAAGEPWDALVRRRILEPVGLRETVTGLAQVAGRANVATAHVRVNDSTRAIPERDLDNVAPAGSMHASAHDMARWLAFLMDSARADGRTFFSAGAWRQMFSPQFVVPLDEFYPGARLAGTHVVTYGLGWFLEDYRGQFVAMHTGSIDGMSAIVGILPDRRSGIVVLANLDHAEVRHALLYRALDQFIGGPQRDWSGELRTLYGALSAQQKAIDAARLARRVKGTRPSVPLAGYAGTYANALYGDLRVSLEGGRLVARLGPRMTMDLEHWSWDTFRGRSRGPWDDGDAFVTFSLGTDGTVETATIEGLDPFHRTDPPRAN